MNIASILFLALALPVCAEQVAESQANWHKRYKKQENAPDPAKQLLNTDPEPDLGGEFVQLFNGKDLDGWEALGGKCSFEVKDGMIVGTCVPGSPSTYLSTEKTDYTDFLFTCEMKWEVNSNSGVMFRAQSKPGKKDNVTVFGPQAEMESPDQGRGWSGGVYGQSCGGYFYPLWLEAHEKIRNAIKPDDWNRLTILAEGNTVKTWVNGVPAAHWIDDGTYPKGFFGLQIHSGKKGKVLWRKVAVREK